MHIKQRLRSYFWPFKGLLLAILVLIGYFLLARIVFLACNYRLFTFHGPAEILHIFWWGSRMDLSAIALLNIPVVLLFFITQYLSRPAPWLLITRCVFVLGNGAGMALNILDAGYFPFSKHRSNIDLWYVLGDSAGSFATVLLRNWPLVLFFLLSIWGLIRLSRYSFPPPTREIAPPPPALSRQQAPPPRRPLPPPAPPQAAPLPSSSSRRALAVAQLTLLLLLFLALRGVQPRPLIPASPLLDLDPDKLPLAQNSVSTLCYSLLYRERQMRPEPYFPEAELRSIVTTKHALSGPLVDSPCKKNVILFILESFSRCYVLPGDRHKAHTPFIDSLLRKSLFFSHAFANGFSSNQGIVAILAGLPALTDEPFFYSPYANTPLHSIGNILKERGYNTNFFMGAGRDHFGFGKLARMAGLDHTYWQNDFNDDRFYDGNWGIFDEPFLQFGAQVLSTKPQPFFATFFTISAHPPYTIPTADRHRFDFPDQSPAQRSIAYTDYALQQFFSTSSRKPWFHNTIFVFCADHWLSPDDQLSFSDVEKCTIPLFVYDPDHDTGINSPLVAGQVDLAPTILDLLGYRGAYSGFGRDLLDPATPPADRYVINRLGDIYQIITDEYILGYNPSQGKSNFLYRYSTDSALQKNLLDEKSSNTVRQRLETLVKANIQAYRQALTRRSLE